MRYVVGIVNNPYSIIEHNVYGGKPVAYSYYTLFVMGFTTPMPAGANWIQTYDVVNNIYVASYSPVPPQEFVPDPVTYVSCFAPTVNPLTGAPIVTPTVMSLIYDSVVVLDEEKFKESLRRLHLPMR